MRPRSNDGRFVQYIGVDALRPGSSTRRARGAVEAGRAHGAERRRHVISSVERRQLCHAVAVGSQEVVESIRTDEATEFPATPPRRDVDLRYGEVDSGYSTVTDLARLRGLSTS